MYEARLTQRLNAIHENVLKNVFLEKHTKTIEETLLQLAGNERIKKEVPGIERAAGDYISAREDGDVITRECALSELYTFLHQAGTSYSPSELEVLKGKKGITSLPGGIASLLMAEPLIGPGSVVADLGSGNGLQGLLLQRMSPHRKTVQVELSSEMIRVGRMYQSALGIYDGRVEWVHGDIGTVSLEPMDFIYMYRPAKPHGEGNALYRSLVKKLCDGHKSVTILSVADCLGNYLDDSFYVLYSNDFLTCFVRE